MTAPSISGIMQEKIIGIIHANGPISIAQYMHLCMNEPECGYYHNKHVIGKQGDFITAPEVSQMFGELIGIWCISAWHALGKPAPFHLVELGPGNGTLMADLLRACKIVPDFLAAANIQLIEISPLCIANQKKKIEASKRAYSMV